MPVELLSPAPQPTGSYPMSLPGRITWQCPYGLAEVVLDTCSFDFHMDVDPQAPTHLLPGLIERLGNVGYEPLPEDECEPELLDSGRTRIYLVPIVPLDDMLVPGLGLIPEPRTQEVTPETVAPRPTTSLALFIGAFVGLSPYVSAPMMAL